jgi:tetratricopeptide (TPR) repeat protein
MRVEVRRAALVVSLLLAGASLRAQSAAQLTESGFRALQNNEPDTAAALFRDALARNPNDPMARFGAGAAAFLQGDLSAARTELTEALRLQPKITQASIILGEILHRQGELDLAIKTYDQALKYEPYNSTLAEKLRVWRGEAEVHSGFEERRSNQFTIMFDGQTDRALAAHATEALEASYWRIGKAMGTYPTSPINVVLYTARQFQDITQAPEWAAGGYDGQIRVPVAGALRKYAVFDKVLAHELTHAMIWAIAPRGVPTWLHEGLAQYFSTGDVDGAVQRLRTRRILVHLSSLQNGFTHLSTTDATLAYDESMMATVALLDRVGASLNVVLTDMANGMTLDDALTRFQLTPALLEQGILQRLK